MQGCCSDVKAQAPRQSAEGTLRAAGNSCGRPQALLLWDGYSHAAKTSTAGWCLFTPVRQNVASLLLPYGPFSWLTRAAYGSVHGSWLDLVAWLFSCQI